jgi:hypothetical protein
MTGLNVALALFLAIANKQNANHTQTHTGKEDKDIYTKLKKNNFKAQARLNSF